MSSCLFNAKDIAIYFSISDFPLSKEREILDNIMKSEDIKLSPIYKNNRYKLLKDISIYRLQYECNGNCSDINIINIILKDIGSKYKIDKVNFDKYCIESFFKIIKLQLTYTDNCKCIRFKFKTMLAKLGYKIRSKSLVDNINETMLGLGLKCYIKDNVKCYPDIVKLDKMVMIRLE